MANQTAAAKENVSSNKAVKPANQAALTPQTEEEQLAASTLANPAAAPASQILSLQRKAGNQAVQRLLAQHKLQAKLTVGAAHDAYEQEADRVASQVMAANPPAAAQRAPEEEDEIQTKPLASTITSLAQRAPEEEEEIQTRRAEPAPLVTQIHPQAALVERLLQRVFDANTPSTYDDDGGHAMARHGAAVTAEQHEARAKTNAPTYSSSGWASEAMMKSAVTKAVATHVAPAAKKSATKWYKKWTVNVSLAKCGYTWLYDATADKVNKIDVDTAVVIFSVEESTGNILYMVTAFPGGPAKEFNATA